MYTAAFGVDDRSALVDALRSTGFGHLVTVSDAGEPDSTSVPFLVDDGATTLRAHLARANPHWRSIDGRGALMIVGGANAYVSPNWYPSKVENHRVVPTWNYELVHVRGTVTVHDDADWKLRLVTDLTNHHETLTAADSGAAPWTVDDAPADFIAQQLAAIVGLELTITDATLKQKLSQNKPEADRRGAAAGLRSSANPAAHAVAVADLMEAMHRRQ